MTLFLFRVLFADFSALDLNCTDAKRLTLCILCNNIIQTCSLDSCRPTFDSRGKGLMFSVQTELAKLLQSLFKKYYAKGIILFILFWR